MHSWFSAAFKTAVSVCLPQQHGAKIMNQALSEVLDADEAPPAGTSAGGAAPGTEADTQQYGEERGRHAAVDMCGRRRMHAQCIRRLPPPPPHRHRTHES